MINLEPIAKQVQDRLFQKMAAVGKETLYPDSNKQILTQSDMLTRTTFIKMCSAQANPIIMMGGEMTPTGETDMNFDGTISEVKKMSAGFDAIYGPKIGSQVTDTGNLLTDTFDVDVLDGEFDITELSGDASITNPNTKSRPIAGIKSIDVSFKGGARAQREATINWTCWSFEDITRLTPHFLAHGKEVLLEWGWIFNEKSIIDLPSFIDTNGIRRDAYTDYINEILDKGGDFDMMVGQVKNFEYTTRDDGAFDCQTILGSIGVNILGNYIPEDNTLKPQQVIKATTKEEKDGIIDKLKNALKNEDSKDSLLGYDLELTLKTLISKLDAYMVDRVFKDPEMKKSKQNIRGEKSQTSYYSGRTSQTKGDVFVKPNRYIVILDTSSANARTCWVRWGWFEDNILSKFTSLTSDENEIVTEFRSIDVDLKSGNKSSVKIKNSPFLETINTQYYILPGQFKPRKAGIKVDVGGTEVELGKDNDYLTQLADIVNTNFPRFDGVEAVDTKPEKYEGDGPQNAKLLKALGAPEGTASITDYLKSKNRKSDIESRRKLWNETFGSSITPNPNVGLLRNMLINVDIIKESFKDASSLQEGLDILFNKLNTPINFWSFEILQDPIDVHRCKIIDDQNTGVDFTKPIKSQRSLYNINNNTFINHNIFYFPVWQSNSIVKSQNVTAKIPDAMQLAVMYGSNMDQVKNISGPSGFAENSGVIVGGLNNNKPDTRLKGLDFAFKNFKDGGGNIGTKNGFANEELSLEGGRDDGLWDYIKNHVAKDVFDTIENEEIKNKNEVDATEQISYLKVKHDKNKPIPLINFLEDTDTKTIFENVDSVNVEKIKEMYGSKYTYDGYHHGAIKTHIEKSILHLTRNHSKKSEGDEDKSHIIPLEMELEIDGTGGIYPGNSFHSTYLPKAYQEKAVFQMFDVNHRVDSSGWITSITGKMRSSVNQVFDIMSKDDVLKDLMHNYKNMLADNANYQKAYKEHLEAQRVANEKARIAQEKKLTDQALSVNRGAMSQKENVIIDAAEDTKKGVVTQEKPGDQTIIRPGVTVQS